MKEPRPNLVRLGTAMRERRGQLGMTQRDASAAAGVTETTWGEYERGVRDPRAVNAFRIDAALQWPPRTTAAYVAGDPVPTGAAAAPPAPTSPTDRPLAERVAALEALVARQGVDIAELRAMMFDRK